ncbi:uncharacterized protein BJ171DRAFT_122085 [Polychytrium aggregatum]|uniref:uncharacterized protein n=1 Tax=Polychytrium aggregatum TaxID=110093 RepID=UPI0022FF25C8|nr:uncharacterized protein BJ171DRAFT_122085 [Polychytrium aggregatum]KAI9204268.1 hypothetical protein BJ171DRAFT_122085 [Polychytrium aggregatum]
MEEPPQPAPKKDWSHLPTASFNVETGTWSKLNDDGVRYEWDDDKQAWFPMWDETLIQSQQSAYKIDGVEEEEPAARPRDKRKVVYTGLDQGDDSQHQKKPKPEAKKPPNTSIYVTGLPPDTTVDEMKDSFGKYGIIMEDLLTGQPRIKLYKDQNGNLKGDALVTYFKEESVALACNLMDEAEFRFGEASKIRVQPAVFEAKEKQPLTEEQKAAAEKKRLDKQRAKKQMQKLEKRLDWFDDEVGKKTEKLAKTIILKHMFTPKEIEDDPTLLLDLKDDVRDECTLLGEVTNVVLYDKSEDGAMSVRFKDAESAELCVARMNGRFFAGRRIEAYHFDGKEKFEKSKTKGESEEEEKQRIEAYEKWLEDQH